MLEVANLSLAYGLHRALDGVALNVGRGEIVTILGANGAGKTSLLKAIAGVVRTLPGKQVSLAGRDISALPAHEIVESGLALVPEGRGIFGDLTVKENLLLGANPKRARDGEAARREQVLGLFPRLRNVRPDRAHHSAANINLALAAPEFQSVILLLDEPRSAPPAMVQSGFHLLRVREAGLGLLVEQNAQESLRIADRGYVLENGIIVGHGTADHLKSDPAVQRAYLGGAAPAAAPSS